MLHQQQQTILRKRKTAVEKLVKPVLDDSL